MFMAIFWLLIALVLVRLLVVERQGRLPPERVERMDGELARLREEVDRLSGRVDRLLEEQSFLVRLLNDGDAARLPRPEARSHPEEQADRPRQDPPDPTRRDEW